MINGLVIGKFFPPHKGHKFLFDSAIKRVDNLYIIVCERNWEIPNGKLRMEWIKEWYLNNKNVHVQLYQYGYDNDDPKLWAKKTEDLLGFIPNFVFTSENYGDKLAEYLNSQHILIDLDRITVPISATKIRNDPLKYLDYLEDNVRSFYTKN